MEKLELKPCPFCGGEAKLFQDNQVSEPDNWFARCDPCDLIREQAFQTTREEAIKAWNTRANDEEIARLKSALERSIGALDEMGLVHTADSFRQALGEPS